LLLQKKPSSLLLAIPRCEKPYVSVLMKEADTTFAHATNLLSDFEACGLIEFASEGRMKYVQLTRRGREVVKTLQALDGVLGGGSLLKDLRRLELRVNRIEGRLSAGVASKRTVRSLDDIASTAAAIEAEAEAFANDRLDYEIKVLKERLGYLRTKLPADAAAGQ